MADAVEKGLRTSPNSDSRDSADHGGGGDDGKARMLSDADLGCISGALAESIIDELRTFLCGQIKGGRSRPPIY
jgi:hypothetical protein